jgi:DNA mismatch repair protein MutL
MASRIKILDSKLIDQIAAGEVVERPASVVKELIENSLDAGAKKIVCYIKEGGQELIRITDDGQGMSAEDMAVAVKRHATSKISSAEDLESINTLGFRGEALPSIAAVSRLKIVSRQPEEQAGCRLVIEGGNRAEWSDVGAPVGTEIEVADLFFNTPARKKFLKRPATELAHIQSWIIRLGLIRPDIHMKLEHGKRVLFDAPPTADLAQRAAALLGREVFEHLYPINYQENGMKVSGLVSDPDQTRTNSKGIYFFVNQRFIRDRVLQHAVLHGYQTVLPHGKYPIAVIHLEMDPTLLDVNVHPQKTEVRFVDSQSVHRAISTAVAEVLARSPWVKGVKKYILHSSSSVTTQDSGRPEPYQKRVSEAIIRYQAAFSPSKGKPPQRRKYASPQHCQEASTELPLSQYGYVGNLWDTYILLAAKDRLVVLDQHAAAERITFERLRQSITQKEVSIQRLLVPIQFEAEPFEMASLKNYPARVFQLGFEMEQFGPQTIKVTGVPALLSESNHEQLARDLLSELNEIDQSLSWEQAQIGVISKMACHSSVRAGQSLNEEKVRSLLTQLEEVDFAGRCPHGRPVVAEFDRAQVAKWFLRG